MTTARFLTIDQVAEELATSRAQIYALFKRRDLVGIKDRWPRAVARRTVKVRGVHRADLRRDRRLARQARQRADG